MGISREIGDTSAAPDDTPGMTPGRVAALLILNSGLAMADSVGPPLPPTDFSIVKEEPCDPKARLGTSGTLIGHYMCQIGLDGQWFQPYACELIRSAGTASYLRFAKWNLPCEIVGTVTHKSLAFDGSMMCDLGGSPADKIGNDALLTKARLVPIAGGFRIEQTVELVKQFAVGPGDVIPRPTRTTMTKPRLALNVCRRAWPNGFVSDNERAEAMYRDD